MPNPPRSSALAYLVPPVSGLVAYLMGATARTRFHGLQSVAIGVVWPLALYAAALSTPGVTQAVALAGAGGWLVLLLVTALGRDPSLPLVGRALRRLARDSPRDLKDGP